MKWWLCKAGQTAQPQCADSTMMVCWTRQCGHWRHFFPRVWHNYAFSFFSSTEDILSNQLKICTKYKCEKLASGSFLNAVLAHHRSTYLVDLHIHQPADFCTVKINKYTWLSDLNHIPGTFLKTVTRIKCFIHAWTIFPFPFLSMQSPLCLNPRINRS